MIIWRWVQRCGSELEARLRRHLKPTNTTVTLRHYPRPLPPRAESAASGATRRIARGKKYRNQGVRMRKSQG